MLMSIIHTGSITAGAHVRGTVSGALLCLVAVSL
jgi:hypothetical protein